MSVRQIFRPAWAPVVAAAVLLPAGVAAQTTGTPLPVPPADSVARDTLPPAPPADTAVAPEPFWPELARRRFITLGGAEDDRLRLLQLVGQAPTDGTLIRTATRPAGAGEARRDGVWVIAPELRTVWNSDLPFSLNDGAMWAGRGSNLGVTGGVHARWGPVSLTLAPELVYQQNREFDFIPQSRRELSPYVFPWHVLPESLDYPSRFGDEAFRTAGLGQSALAVDLGPVQTGFSTQNQWWGPGIRNAVVMSNHAAGIPHLFLQTRRPLRTFFGDVEGRWIVGSLTESDYYDFDSTNDTRSLSGLVVTARPRWATDLTLGLARTVYRPVDDRGSAMLRLFDVFTDVGRPNDQPADDLEREPGPDQVSSLFARWVSPGDGLEAYVEWARHERPASLRDWLLAPQHSQGYTLGLQWARPVGEGSLVRLQSEMTFLEQSSDVTYRRVTTWYASRPVLQGYTQRGQVIGASIGPGASSQWVAGDYYRRRWNAGLFAGRIRWDNDAMYESREDPLPFGHDVSVFAGVRGGVRLRGVEVAAEYTGATRLNYLYQHLSTTFESIRGMDLHNHTLRFSVTPRLP